MEDRPFNPHLTLGRVKRINSKEELKTLVEHYINYEIQIVPVNEVILFESILLNSGPVYKPLTRIELSVNTVFSVHLLISNPLTLNNYNKGLNGNFQINV